MEKKEKTSFQGCLTLIESNQLLPPAGYWRPSHSPPIYYAAAGTFSSVFLFTSSKSIELKHTSIYAFQVAPFEFMSTNFSLEFRKVLKGSIRM